MRIKTVFLSVFFSVFTTLSWGETWELSATMKAVLSNGVLTISTTANAEAMPDYDISTPWSNYRSDIRSVVIENKVTGIGRVCFSECSNLISVAMSNVTTIKPYAFFRCVSLTSITMPNVTSIGEAAFYKCEDITSLTMPKVTTIGLRAFDSCSGLTSLTMPNVTTMESFAFNRCTALTSVTMPNVITIGKEAFYQCTALASVTMPNVITIRPYAFSGCTALTSVIMPKLTTIESYAFSPCTALTSLTLPKSVYYIQAGAFQDCTGLKNVNVEWESPLPLFSSFIMSPYGIDDLGGKPLPFFGVNTSKITLHVPPGTKALYAAADVWKDFGTITETGVIPEVTQPVSEKGSGVISLSLYIPGNTTLTGSFEIQLPDGLTLDGKLTALSSELDGSATLSFTSISKNTWKIEIKPNALKSANVTEYRKIMDIAYKANSKVAAGLYNAKIMNLDFTASDGTSIKEELLNVTIHITQNLTSVEQIGNTSFKAYFQGDMLRVESPHAETVTVYSVTGEQLLSTVKSEGVITIPFSTHNGTITIIKGSKSGTVKTVK